MRRALVELAAARLCEAECAGGGEPGLSWPAPTLAARPGAKFILRRGFVRNICLKVNAAIA